MPNAVLIALLQQRHLGKLFYVSRLTTEATFGLVREVVPNVSQRGDVHLLDFAEKTP